MGKSAIFIDEGYVAKILKDSFFSPAIDYAKFSQLLAHDNQILRTYYYTALPYKSKIPTPEEQKRFDNKQRFLDSLRRLNFFEVRLGKIQMAYDKFGRMFYRQKRVDALLTLDLVRLAMKQLIEEAIIVSGDSDFIPAIECAKEEGIQVQLVYEAEHLPSNDLLLTVDTRRELTPEDIDYARLEK